MATSSIDFYAHWKMKYSNITKSCKYKTESNRPQRWLHCLIGPARYSDFYLLRTMSVQKTVSFSIQHKLGLNWSGTLQEQYGFSNGQIKNTACHKHNISTSISTSYHSALCNELLFDLHIRATLPSMATCNVKMQLRIAILLR